MAQQFNIGYNVQKTKYAVNLLLKMNLSSMCGAQKARGKRTRRQNTAFILVWNVMHTIMWTAFTLVWNVVHNTTQRILSVKGRILSWSQTYCVIKL